jgi:ABC-type bacteriocin/lantibiotic exporter with double-glycine peptidase domain
MKTRRYVPAYVVGCVVAAWGWLTVAAGSVSAASDPLCGAECLYTALVALDVEPGNYADFLQQAAPTDPRGLSLGRLAELAEERGLSTLLVETSLANLRRRRDEPPFVCLAHVDGDHFLLIGDIQPQTVWTIDPPAEREVAAAVFQQRWRGHALLLSRQPLRPEAELPVARDWWWLGGPLIAVGGLIYGVGFFLWRRQSR